MKEMNDETIAGCDSNSQAFLHMTLTFWHIESRKKELAISNSTLPSTGITNHRSDEIANKFNMSHKLLRRHAFGKRR